MDHLQPADESPDKVRGSLADLAYESLSRQILSSQLAPGSSLSVPALARTMGLGRSPVREAVQRLIHDGLASHIPHKGAQVLRLDVSELMQIYEVKAPLEALASKLAAGNISEDGVNQLRLMLAAQEEALTSGVDESEFMRLDTGFHLHIHQIAGNPVLTTTIAQFTSKTNLAYPSAWGNPDYARLSIEEHRAIAEAIISGDSEEAERVTMRHLLLVRRRLGRWQATRLAAHTTS